jgi:hypothetical protein
LRSELIIRYNQAIVKHKYLRTTLLAGWSTILVFAFSAVLAVQPVLADTCGTGGPEVGTGGLSAICGKSSNPIYALIEGLANWLIGLLGGIAILIIIIAGIQYITSQGNPAQIKSAKDRITNAVVGLLLLLFMFVILRVLGVTA